MKLFVNLFFLTSCIFVKLDAALPPLYESLNEYKALLNSQEIGKLGSAEGIQNIQRTDTGFIITTFRFLYRVDRIFEPQNQPGPARFHFIFHEPEKL